MGDVLAYRYKIVRKLGEGAFGKVYEVHHIKDPSKRYVIKTEQLATRFNTLTTEKTVLKSMRKEVGFPKYHKLIYF
jgi:serine/threonine protein kinase